MRYKWLSLSDVLRAVPAMERHNVSRVARGKEDSKQTKEGFVEAYIATGGSIPKMKKRFTGRNEKETWSDRRNQFIARHLTQMRNFDTYSDGWLPNGEPTPRHLGLIAWAYSPSPKRLSEWLKTQPKEWKQFVSNPVQLMFDFAPKDQYIPSLDEDMVEEIVFAVLDRENKEPTTVIGSKKSPKSKGLTKAINAGYIDVVRVVPHKLSGMMLWTIKPTRKGFALVKKRRKIISDLTEQLSLFAANPGKPKKVVVPIHFLSSQGIHEKIGTISLNDSRKGLEINTSLSRLPPGDHGTHIHEFGSLAPKIKGDKVIAGGAAGSHYDPDGAGYHGSPTGTGHKGDLPKIHANAHGESNQTLYAPRLTLKEIMGRSIVIHRYGDNYSDTPLPNGGGKERMAGGIIAEHCAYCKKNPVVKDGKGRNVPQRYIEGYTGKQLEKRIKEIERRRNEYVRAYKKYGDEQNFPQELLDRIYRPFVTDKYVAPKESIYTKEAHDRGFFGDWREKAKIASKYYGGKIEPEILHDVYRRGVGAWPTGHRGGATKEQWGNGRVNSFLVGGKAFFTSDQDLAKELPNEVYSAIVAERTWKNK